MLTDIAIDMGGYRLQAVGKIVIGTGDLAKIDLDVTLMRQFVDQPLHRFDRYHGVLIALQDEPR